MSRLEKLKEFLTADPNDSFTQYLIALEYASQGDHKTAVGLLESLRASSPEYVPTYYQLAAFHRELGDNSAARDIYVEGIRRARGAGDLHAASELQAALDELDDES